MVALPFYSLTLLARRPGKGDGCKSRDTGEVGKGEVVPIVKLLIRVISLHRFSAKEVNTRKIE
jgi:hypothetical protein